MATDANNVANERKKLVSDVAEIINLYFNLFYKLISTKLKKLSIKKFRFPCLTSTDSVQTLGLISFKFFQSNDI